MKIRDDHTSRNESTYAVILAVKPQRVRSDCPLRGLGSGRPDSGGFRAGFQRFPPRLLNTYGRPTAGSKNISSQLSDDPLPSERFDFNKKPRPESGLDCLTCAILVPPRLSQETRDWSSPFSFVSPKFSSYNETLGAQCEGWVSSTVFGVRA